MSFEITVRERRGDGTTASLPIKNDRVRLRGLQEDLCLKFKKPFPETMASLTVNGIQYEEFNEQPFKCNYPLGECVVEFKKTDNPLFYDEWDRRKNKLTLEQEMNPQARPPLPDLTALPPLSVLWTEYE